MFSSPSGRHTFRKPERLASKLAFDQLMKSGRRITDTSVSIVWKSMPLPTSAPVQVAFSVPKRQFSRAVDRNRIKRLMREVYRKNKNIVYPLLAEKRKQYAILFVYTSKTLPAYPEIAEKITTILNRLAEIIQQTPE
jgi:ribonuclease P protein component